MLNKVMLIGHLGNDPEMTQIKSGDVVTNFRLATSEKWTDKAGERQERTEWHQITAFGKLAEICKEYLTSGSQVYVEGKIQTQKYEKDGETRYTTKIIAREIKFLDLKKEK